MRYRIFITAVLLIVSGCTGTRISSTKLADLQATAATHPSSEMEGHSLWYVGSKLVYDYYVLVEPDESSDKPKATTYHVRRLGNSLAPAERFYYTTDSSKWVMVGPALPTAPSTQPAAGPITRPAAKPVLQPSRISLDDLHT